MLTDLDTEAKKVGLDLHHGKTKVLNNGFGQSQKINAIQVNGVKIEVLDRTSGTMYLGRMLTLTNAHEGELRHRIACAWRKFGMLKRGLCDKKVSLHQRLRLFHAVVTPSILYGCASWVLTRSMENDLRTVQRKMLRAVLGKWREASSRQDEDPETSTDSDDNVDNVEGEDIEEGEILESWVEWKRRVTHYALEAINKVSVPDWAEEQRRRKWRWCGHVARRTDGRWTNKVLEWQPSGNRKRRHPKLRWEDGILSFWQALGYNMDECEERWRTVAQLRDDGKLLEEDFATAGWR